QLLEVLIPDAHAAVRNAAPELARRLRPVNGVAVAEVQAVVPEGLLETALPRAERRNDDGLAGAQEFFGRDLLLGAVRPPLHDRVLAHFEHAPRRAASEERPDAAGAARDR